MELCPKGTNILKYIPGIFILRQQCSAKTPKCYNPEILAYRNINADIHEHVDTNYTNIHRIHLKKFIEHTREFHNQKPQPIPDFKRKRKRTIYKNLTNMHEKHIDQLSLLPREGAQGEDVSTVKVL